MIGGPFTEKQGFNPQMGMPDAAIADPIQQQDSYDLDADLASRLPGLMQNDGLSANPIADVVKGMPAQDAGVMGEAPGAGTESGGIEPVTGQPIEPNQLAPAPTPGQEAQQGRRPKVSISGPTANQRYRYTQEDFYGPRKDFQWNDATGAPMQLASAGQFPATVLFSRLGAMQEERAANKQAMQQLAAGAGKGVKTAPPYQQSLTQALAAGRTKFVSDLAQQYGGNEDLAWQEISRNPETMSRYMDLHRGFEAIGQHGEQTWADAKKYLDEARTGDVHVDKETLDLAQEIYYGLGNMRGTEDIGDIYKLVGSMAKFQHSVSRGKFAKEQVVPGLKEKYKRAYEDAKYKSRNGILIREQDINYDGTKFLEAAARSMEQTIVGTTYEDNLKWLSDTFPPEQIKQEVIMRAIPDRSGSGGGGGGRPKSGVTLSSAYGQVEGLSSKGQYHQVRVNKVTSGAGGFMPAAPFLQENGEPVTLHPVAVFENEKGELMISGKVGGDPRSRVKAKPKAGDSDPFAMIYTETDPKTGEETEIDEATYFDNLPVQVLPYRGANEAAWEQSTGQSNQQIMQAIGESKAKHQGVKHGTQPKTATTGMVKMRLPSGQVGDIPADKLADFKKKYPDAIEVK